MRSQTEDTDVVVIGAGLSGLAAAARLRETGHHVRVLEADDDIGGRVRTDLVGGFLLDRGFQLLNPAYPAVRDLIDVPALDPQRFWRALRVVDGNRTRLLGNPLDSPRAVRDLLAPGPVNVRDVAALAGLSLRDAAAPARLLTAAADQSTALELHRWGLSERCTSEVLRPFLTGVFGESDLTTSARFFDLVWRSFLRAAPVLPAGGMGRLAHQLGDRLADGTVALRTPVHSVEPGLVHAAGVTHRARAVLVATDGSSASELLGRVRAPSWNGLRTFYYRVPGAPQFDPVVTVDARRSGPAVNSAAISAVSGSCAPPGQALISATTLLDARGEEPGTEPALREQLGRLHRTSTAGWELIADYPIPRALPHMPAPHRLRAPGRLAAGLHVCGDHRSTSSIQGALDSGMRAAGSIAAELRG